MGVNRDAAAPRAAGRTTAWTIRLTRQTAQTAQAASGYAGILSLGVNVG